MTERLKSLPELSEKELLDLVRLLPAPPQQPENVMFLLKVASELRRRALYATEDYVVRLAAGCVTNA